VNCLDGLNVLVTGANGFFGRHLIERLSEHSARVQAVSRRVPSFSQGVKWVQGDLTSGDWVHELIRSTKPDVVYHLASASLGGQESEFVLPTFENDLRSTINTLLAAKACGCSRVVLVASLEEPVCDGRPIIVSSPYAAAKAASTYYGLMFHQLYRVPVIMLRVFMTYGPGQKAYKVIPFTILSLLKRQPPRLSSGVRLVDWVFVKDVITAFITAAVSPEAVGTVIDIGSGRLVKVCEVVEQIHKLIPGSPVPLIGALPDRVMETVRCADTEAAMRILDWKATTPLRAGLSATIAWYRDQLSQNTGSWEDMSNTSLPCAPLG
jgi:nucleoside-diphosphate-sugar epimerase